MAAIGLSRVADELGVLDGLDGPAIAAVIDAVLAERSRHDERRLELVWTGPEAVASTARDTRVIVRELFASAERSVLVAGFRFDHGAELLAPLAQAMRVRGVRADLFLHLPPGAPGASEEQLARAGAAAFRARNWPFGSPYPELYYDPRTLAPQGHISLHAKCVVVDERRTFISSANFTDHGHGKNVEVGVLIEDRRFAEELVGQWMGAVSAGYLRRCAPSE